MSDNECSFIFCIGEGKVGEREILFSKITSESSNKIIMQ